MADKKDFIVDFFQPEEALKLFPIAPIVSSHNLGWKNINLASYELPPGKIPETIGRQHTIVFASPKQTVAAKISFSDLVHSIALDRSQIYLGILPANVPTKISWNGEIEFTNLYIEPQFLEHIVPEFFNLNRVDLMLSLPPKFDPFLWQMGSALKSVLVDDPHYSCFYAESIAVALAGHLLQFYTNRSTNISAYTEGLPISKIKQAIAYINESLMVDLSLTKLAAKIDMSPYYFCRLFKQSIGMTPHQYLIQKRIERAKLLLKQPERKIVDIAAECGFANPSHFARCFRKSTGMTPKEFRLIKK
jgi:AraC family transcriptional regulator